MRPELELAQKLAEEAEQAGEPWRTACAATALKNAFDGLNSILDRLRSQKLTTKEGWLARMLAKTADPDPAEESREPSALQLQVATAVATVEEMRDDRRGRTHMLDNRPNGQTLVEGGEGRLPLATRIGDAQRGMDTMEHVVDELEAEILRNAP